MKVETLRRLLASVAVLALAACATPSTDSILSGTAVPVLSTNRSTMVAANTTQPGALAGAPLSLLCATDASAAPVSLMPSRLGFGAMVAGQASMLSSLRDTSSDSGNSMASHMDAARDAIAGAGASAADDDSTALADNDDTDAVADNAPDVSKFAQKGNASWYGPNFHGHRTANGERYDMYALTAAHRTLPLSSYVRVTNADNDRSVVVRINDRGPFHGNRIIDLSFAAARALGIQARGTGHVLLTGLSAAEARTEMSGTVVASR